MEHMSQLTLVRIAVEDGRMLNDRMTSNKRQLPRVTVNYHLG